MWRLALKQVMANRLRFLLTSLAVVLGVTFVSGTLVLTDTAQQQFDDRFADRNAGFDLTIRTEVAFDEAMGVEVEHEPLPAELVDTAATTEGVQSAVGVISGKGTILVEGRPASSGEAMLMSWAEAPYGGFTISSGREPEQSGEVVVDSETARLGDLQVGSDVTVQSDRIGRFRVVGIAEPDREAAYDGASVALTTVSDAQRLLRLGNDISEVRLIAEPAASVRSLEDRLRVEVGEGYAVASSKDVAQSSTDAARTQLAYLRGMLLALAAAALLIGGYLIANTFSIVVTQRTRELALLRAAGATGRQVRRLLRGEALVLGVLGSAIGAAAGVGAAAVLRGLLAGTGADLPSGPAVVRPTSMLLAFTIGVVVTVLASIAPSRRAGRVSPLQVLRTTAAVTASSKRRRFTGAVAGAAAVTGLVAVTLGQSGVPVLAGAAVAAIVALAALGPAFAGPLTKVVGRPFAAAGVPGRLAGEFAARAPRRTAATVMALTFSVALVAFMTVLATSVKEDVADRYEEIIRADLVVQSAGQEMLGGLSPAVHDRVADLPEVEVASRMQFGHIRRDGMANALTAVDPSTIDGALRIDLLAGQLSDLDGGGVMVSERIAEREQLEPGDPLSMTFPRDGEQVLRVVGVFDDELVAATQTDYLVSLDTYARHYTEDVDANVFVTLAAGVDQDAAQAAIEAALRDVPNAEVLDQDAAAEGRTAMVDQMLGMVTVLLLLTVLIALLGITNTLALSIVERTREIGLLRAIGMTGRQLRWMVRIEAAIQAALAVVLGSVVGLAFAAVAVRQLVASDPIGVVVPWAWLAAVVVLGTAAGLVAGLLPARRAARLRLMEAIATA